MNRKILASISQYARQTMQKSAPVLRLCLEPGHINRLLKLFFSNEAAQLTNGEKVIVDKLKGHFTDAHCIKVSDISGGCGAMYKIIIEAEEFRGKKTLDQHHLVNEVLAEEIKAMHGLQLTTKVPEKIDGS